MTKILVVAFMLHGAVHVAETSPLPQGICQKAVQAFDSLPGVLSVRCD